MHHVCMISVVLVRDVDVLRGQQRQRQDAQCGDDSYEPLHDATEPHGPILCESSEWTQQAAGWV
jgi:hypothetical protein